MTPLVRLAAAAALVLPLGACSLSGMLGGGGKAPAALYVLTAQAPEPDSTVREAAAGEAVTVHVPVIAKELRTNRVPVQVGPTEVQYIKDMAWVDTPDRLFKTLLEETIRRTTNRVVLDPDQTVLDPGLVITGKLWSFGYDSMTGEAVVRFDGALATEGGSHVETRVFTSRVPASGAAADTSAALNQAANQVALEVARWIGG